MLEERNEKNKKKQKNKNSHDCIGEDDKGGGAIGTFPLQCFASLYQQFHRHSGAVMRVQGAENAQTVAAQGESVTTTTAAAAANHELGERVGSQGRGKQLGKILHVDVAYERQIANTRT